MYESGSSVNSHLHNYAAAGVMAGCGLLICWLPVTAAVALPVAATAFFWFILPDIIDRKKAALYSKLPVSLQCGTFRVADEPGGLHGHAEYDPVVRDTGIADWRREVQRMPEVFKSLNPKLVMSEANVAGYVGGVPFFGTVDQVFEGRNGSLYIVDTKTHAKPSAPRAEEILQLSVYRALLVQQYGEDRVSKEAFIRSIADNADGLPVYRRISLLSTELVEELAKKAKTVRSTS